MDKTMDTLGTIYCITRNLTTFTCCIASLALSIYLFTVLPINILLKSLMFIIGLSALAIFSSIAFNTLIICIFLFIAHMIDRKHKGNEEPLF